MLYERKSGWFDRESRLSQFCCFPGNFLCTRFDRSSTFLDVVIEGKTVTVPRTYFKLVRSAPIAALTFLVFIAAMTAVEAKENPLMAIFFMLFFSPCIFASLRTFFARSRIFTDSTIRQDVDNYMKLVHPIYWALEEKTTLSMDMINLIVEFNDRDINNGGHYVINGVEYTIEKINCRSPVGNYIYYDSDSDDE